MVGGDEYSTVSSATLLKARQGDDDAWNSIWTRYSHRTFRQTLRFGIGRSDAEDILLEVFRKVWTRLDDFSRNDPGQSLGAWINRITQTTVLDSLKQTQRTLPALGSDAAHIPDSSPQKLQDTPSPLWLAFWQAQRIVEHECSDRAWDCFRLVRLAHMPHSEIADMLGISVSNVSTIANRVFQRLRDQCIQQLTQANFVIDDDGRLIAVDVDCSQDSNNA